MELHGTEGANPVPLDLQICMTMKMVVRVQEIGDYRLVDSRGKIWDPEAQDDEDYEMMIAQVCRTRRRPDTPRIDYGVGPSQPDPYSFAGLHHLTTTRFDRLEGNVRYLREWCNIPKF